MDDNDATLMHDNVLSHNIIFLVYWLCIREVQGINVYIIRTS